MDESLHVLTINEQTNMENEDIHEQHASPSMILSVMEFLELMRSYEKGIFSISM
jgi:hypothetical protein